MERQCVGEQELLRHRSRSIGDEERANFGVVVLILQTSWQQQQQQQQQQHLDVSITRVVAARPPRTPQPVSLVPEVCLQRCFQASRIIREAGLMQNNGFEAQVE